MLKKAATMMTLTRRFSGELIAPKDGDAPLQQAITALKGLGAALESESKDEDAARVLEIINLLRVEHFQRKGSQKKIFDEILKDATPQEVMGMRQWVADDDGDVTPLVVADAAATQNSVLASRLMKWTRKIPKLVLGTDSALLAQMLEHDLLQWEFDTEEIQRLSGGHALLAIGWALFERHDLRAKLDLRTDAVLDFLANVEVGYKAVPYHNSVHAADVTHALHWLLSSYALGKFVKDDPLLLFTVLVSAITHDLGHDGYNNGARVIL